MPMAMATTVLPAYSVYASHLMKKRRQFYEPSPKKLAFQKVEEKLRIKKNEEVFRLPHLKDAFPDASSYPTTFYVPNGNDKFALEDEPVFMEESLNLGNTYTHFSDRILLNVNKFASLTAAGAREQALDIGSSNKQLWVPRAGPRKLVYFRPEEVRAGIVTCGGLCPGLNDVIREIVVTLQKYGVKDITGIRYGFQGFREGQKLLKLSRETVRDIHLSGGSVLGVSRGNGDAAKIVDGIERLGLNMLFVLGGNGTHAGAQAVHEECWRRSMKVVVVGVPKTIDNDIQLVDKTFGFETAVEEAQRAIHTAYVESQSAYRGIGIVKLMGRQSGFIAMHASLASRMVDVCLIPEVPFKLNKLVQHIQHLIDERGSAVVCVAEGAGQELLNEQQNNHKGTDASGNPVLADIGVFLQTQFKQYFKQIGAPADVKYIDPTYMIRACRANSSDGILCAVLGQNAVHGAFAGFSGVTVGSCKTHCALLPIKEVIRRARLVDPCSVAWQNCLTSTGQPDLQ